MSTYEPLTEIVRIEDGPTAIVELRDGPVARLITFRWHRWEFPAGTPRRGLTCNRCDCPGSYPAESTAPELEHVEAAKRHRCPELPYEWDDWRREAWAKNMDPQAAQAGRALLREHYQHQWGGSADPDAMMRRGLRSPRAALRRWSRLLADGNEAELRGARPSLEGES